MKILVRATNWLGDAVMSLPALRALRGKYPEAEIWVLVRPPIADLYSSEQSIDRVIPLAGAPGFRDLSAKREQAHFLRQVGFDLAVIFPNSFESAALVWMAGARRRIGYARDGRSVLLTDAIPVPPRTTPKTHERYYYLELLRRAALIETVPTVSEILLDGLDDARQRGRDLFAEHGIRLPVIGVNPGAAYGGAKRWLPENFAAAARTLAEKHGASVVVFGAAGERDLCEQVAQAAGGFNLAGKTSLREFIKMSAACELVLANDSGAMHVAAATGVPSVTVFGPTDETATGPTGLQAHMEREPVECSRCGHRECPIDHRCMTRVGPERVIVAAEALLQGRSGNNEDSRRC